MMPDTASRIGAAPVREAAPPRTCDILIIGGGPAGSK